MHTFRSGPAVAAISLVFAACSNSGTTPASRPARLHPVCDEAVAQAATAGGSSAKGYARAALSYRIEEVKGFLHADGYGHVKVEPARFSCAPYTLGPVPTGLTRCVASARVCGR